MVDWVKSVIFATTKSHTMLEDKIFEDEILEVEPEQDWLVAEAPSRDISEQVADLHSLKGAGFISMLKEITLQKAFSPLEGENNIYTTGSTKEDDYENLLNVAAKPSYMVTKCLSYPIPRVSELQISSLNARACTDYMTLRQSQAKIL